ncbi:MAG: pyridoxal phosphate-dependent transferase [Linnemannia gamsii]|nr:MAG: pyridoxal phosphate-dependent transferase [Linnemannia gamsii]
MTSTSHITPAAGVRPSKAPLGSAVPDVPHAISVSLPTFRDNVDYEEAAPRVVNAMVSGYPRFFVNLQVKELITICEKKYGKPTESCFLWPSRRVAERCRHFVERYYVPTISTDDSTPTPHTGGATHNGVRIVEFTIQAPSSEVKPGGLKQIKVFAAFFPKEAYSIAKQFWQHAGDIVTSRQAAYCLRWLSLNKAEEEAQEAATAAVLAASKNATRMPRGNRHYAAAGAGAGATKPTPTSSSNGSPTLPSGDLVSGVATIQLQDDKKAVEDVDDEDRPVEETDGIDSRDYEVYVEERYGRNLDLSFAPKAKVALRRRIANQVAHHAGSSWIGAGEYVTEEDVYLYPTGMSAIYNAHRIAMTLFPTRKSICFGFPYTDSLKVLQKFGPGCYFYGNGEDSDIDELEKEVLEKTHGEGVAEEDKILAVFCEFPSNPLLKSSNLVRLGQLADKYGFMIIVDETLGNFVNVRILEYVDIVVSSLSKVFSGDSNVMGGSLVLNPQRQFYKGLKDAMSREYEDLMWVEDAIFMERNSRTFQKRIHRIDQNTEALCDYLRTHPKVKEVYYPKYVTAANYLTHKVEGAGFGGLFSVVFKADEGAEKFFDALPFYKGPSLGTNFTLACPYTILAHYYELEWAAQFGIDRNLIRVAVGLEDWEDLLKGFQEALDAIPA